jgi:hypothetical protein
MLFAVCFGTGCTPFNKAVYNQAFDEIHNSAKLHLENKEYPQALIMYRSLRDAEPKNKEVLDGLNTTLQTDSDLEMLLNKKMLGVNLTDRIKNTTASGASKILLYLPNRILDLIDIVTLEIGPCLGVGLDFKVTEYGSLGAQISGGEAMVGLHRRHLSVRATIDNYIEILPVETRAFIESRASTGGVYSVLHANAGIKDPKDTIYQRARDFWALTTHIQFIIFAERHEVHPIELWDFLAGWAMVDPLNDDLGTSYAIKLTPIEKDSIKRLAKQARARGSQYDSP